MSVGTLGLSLFSHVTFLSTYFNVDIHAPKHFITSHVVLFLLFNLKSVFLICDNRNLAINPYGFGENIFNLAHCKLAPEFDQSTVRKRQEVIILGFT
jgi:hypothetical protein